MLKHLTALFVETVKTADTYTDTDSPIEKGVKGLTLRVTATGHKSYSLPYRNAAGRKCRLTLGNAATVSLKEARDTAREALAQIHLGQDPAASKREARSGGTVADLAEAYLAEYAVKKKDKGVADRAMMAANILPALGTCPLRDVSRRDIHQMLDVIMKRGAPITANRTLALVRKMFNYGIASDYPGMPAGNPATLLPKPGKEQSRDRVLNDDEIRLVWAAIGSETPELCGLLRLMLATGQRAGDLRPLKWADVDGDWLTVPAAIAKNGKAHRVPLLPLAKAALAALPRRDRSPYLFPGRAPNLPINADGPKDAGQRIRDLVLARLQEDDQAATFEYQNRDLRRTTATNLAIAGVPQADIAKVLNHAEGGPKATKVYNKYAYDKEKLKALTLWNQRLSRIVKAAHIAPFVRVTRTRREAASPESTSSVQ